MKPFTKTVGALCITPVDLDDTQGAVSCEVPRCFGMALQRVTIAGHPSGYVCSKHAREYLRIWAELTVGEDLAVAA